MEIGKQLRKARLEAGLSQRQLCGDIITRNMLSQIENGSAVPSLQTLEALARRLHRPMGYFFGETDDPLEPVWQALEAGEPDRAMKELEGNRGGSPREVRILRSLACLAMGEQALEEGRLPYAESLLTRAGQETPALPVLEERCRELAGELDLALGRSPREPLPSLDRSLLLRARLAEKTDPRRAGQLLDAVQDCQSPQWGLLRGRICLGQGEYEKAIPCFLAAEGENPREAAEGLEICYRELGNFEKAYEYACRQRT